MKRLIALTCVFTMLFNLSVLRSKADNIDNTADETVAVSDNGISYKDYTVKYSAMPETEFEPIVIDATSYSAISGNKISVLPEYGDYHEPVIKFENSEENNSITWNINFPNVSKCNIKINYIALENNTDSVDLGIKINGEYPFEGCSDLSLSKVWTNATQDFIKDKAGNEKRPVSKQVKTWQSAYFSDKTGVTNFPYKFVFLKGDNQLTVEGTFADVIIKSIELLPLQKIDTYQAYLATVPNENKNSNAAPILIQCEKSTFKSNSSIIPMEDRGHAETIPSNPVYNRFNTIGDYNWVTQGEWISWDFNVEEPGFYNIGVRVRQNYQRGYASARRIYIDGKVPFEEFDCVEFNYKRNWYFKSLGDKEPKKIYFDKGKHSIAMEIIPGNTADLSSILQESVKEINKIYRDIIMITGTSPDIYRDYSLKTEIPDLNTKLAEQKEILDRQYRKLQDLYGGRDSDTATLQRLITQLTDFIDDDVKIIESINSFADNISSLASWVVRLKEQPLELDYIEIVPEGKDFTDRSVGFFNNLSFHFKQFIASFIIDYSAVGSDIESDEKPLNVWVSLGRDQSQLIRELVDNDFAAKYNIPVSIKLSKGSIIQAAFAGTGPDLALFVTADQPVNLAVRGALADINSFKDSKELLSQFSPEELVGYTYNGKLYGVPLTADLNMMFVRTDIFAQLGLKVPETWDELYKILPVLQRNNMNIGLPKVTIEGAGLVVFNSLLLQNGQNYYSEDGSKTMFDSEVALDAFREWTGYYTKYDIPLDFDFYNRFRSGEIPIGIEAYTLYNKLSVAAPEIAGMWEMVPIPGTLKEDGSVDRSTSLGGTAAIIMAGSSEKVQQSSWKFIKWFASEETQSQYGCQIEALIGEAARYNTANIKAIPKLPWTTTESKLILKQFDSGKGIPQSIAAYYVSRNLYNAFRKVAVNNYNPREVLYRYNIQMNDEIRRKREEFGLS